MNNGIGRPPVLLTLWQRLGAWVDQSGPQERPTAQIFLTVTVVLGTWLCFGFRPVLAGFHDWLQWRLTRSRPVRQRTVGISGLQPRLLLGAAPGIARRPHGHLGRQLRDGRAALNATAPYKRRFATSPLGTSTVYWLTISLRSAPVRAVPAPAPGR